jgi:hypothetical protein
MMKTGITREERKAVLAFFEDDQAAAGAQGPLSCPRCRSTGQDIALSVDRTKAHCYHCDHYFPVVPAKK